MDAISQIIKYVDGNGPDFIMNLTNAIIPVTTTMIVSLSRILKESLILLPFSS
jgi:hypothetical protein